MTSVESLLAMAVAAQRESRLDDAERLYRAVLEQQPDHVEALHLLGVLKHQQGDTGAGISFVERALRMNSAHSIARYNLSSMLVAVGERERAKSEYRRLVEDYPTFTDALVNLGNLEWLDAGFAEAVGWYDRALGVDPNLSIARANKASALLALADRERRQKNFAAALEYATRAIRTNETAKAYIVLGQVHSDAGNLDEAGDAFSAALEHEPQSHDALLNLGSHAYVLGEYEASISYLRRALAIAPNSVRAHFNLAISLLAAGNAEEGLREYEWRRYDEQKVNDFRLGTDRLWTGDPLQSGRLIITHEQGLGDAMFLARYYEQLSTLVAELVIETPVELVDIFAESFPRVTIRRRFDPTDMKETDRHLPAFSIPFVIAERGYATSETFPYLRVDTRLINSARERLALRDDVLNVGIVWAGNENHRLDHFRSIPLHFFEPLLLAPGTRWFSLQHGLGRSQLLGSPVAADVTDIGGEVRTVAETGAVVMLLDLVITVDTSVAHLAGALDRPVWMLVGSGVDWRWGRGGDSTPWYPNMRLIRRRKKDDWSYVIASLLPELDSFALRARGYD